MKVRQPVNPKCSCLTPEAGGKHELPPTAPCTPSVSSRGQDFLSHERAEVPESGAARAQQLGKFSQANLTVVGTGLIGERGLASHDAVISVSP